MTEPFANLGRPALGPRHEPFPHARAVHLYSLDEKSVDIDALGVLRIGHGRTQGLRDNIGRALGQELENIEGLLNSFTANLVDHQPNFLRREPDKSCDRARFHNFKDPDWQTSAGKFSSSALYPPA